jgi:hypothetical protein
MKNFKILGMLVVFAVTAMIAGAGVIRANTKGSMISKPLPQLRVL